MNAALRTLRLWSSFAMIAVCLVEGVHATSLHANFAAAQSVVPTGSLSYPYRIAVDASGNLYISNTQDNEVLKETWSPATQSYTESVIASSGLATPYGIAVDASGNVYIADNGHNRVVKETPSAGSYIQTVVSTTTALSYPTGVAVDANGTLYIADTGGGKILKEVPSGSSYTETALTYAANFAQITGIAVDASGDIFVSDIDNSAVYEETYSAGSYTPSTIPTSGLNYPYDIAVDGAGNLYISDFTNKRIVEETFVSAGNYTQSVFPTANLSGALGIAVDGVGNLYLADTFGFDIKKETLAGANFNSAQVGSASATVSMLFSFTGGDTGDTISLSGWSVLTQGVSGLDFADAGSDGCSTSTAYSAGDSCFVNVTLTPQYPGQRYGAVELLGSTIEPNVVRRNAVHPEESSGSLLATGYMTGLGIGPQVNFQPFSFSNVFRVAGPFSPYDLSNPFDAAVDPSGNVYVADYNQNAVYKETLSAGSYTQSTVASGLSNPEAVAIDGAGNVYIVDSGNNQILMESWQNGSWVQTTVASGLDFPTGVAIDPLGNVYFSSFSDGTVDLLTLSNGVYSSPATLISGLNQPRKIALDGSGNIFIADTGNSRVVKETPNGEGYTQSVIGSNMEYPYGVAVGAAGQVYVADTIHSQILLETPSGEGYTQSVLIPGPPAYGIAVDGQGNIYFPDPADATVFEVGFTEPPTLSFASTIIGSTSSDSPQSTTIVNVGNAPLTIPVPETGSNPVVPSGFTLDGATTCPEIAAAGSAASLAANASCVYAIDFAPTAVSSYSASLVLTDNALNVANATQSIPLSGTGLPLPATQLALSGVPSLLLSGANPGTVTVDVEDANGGVVTGSSASITVTVTGPGGYSQMVSGAAASGVYLANLSALTLTTAGTYTVTATSSDLVSASATLLVEPAEVGLGSQPAGTASGTTTVTIPFVAAVTLGTPAVKVVTQGAAGLDFSDAGTGTCVAGASMAAESSCTVNVIFTPKYPGIRYGAVIVYDGSGNVLATVYLTGTGTGPMVNYSPGFDYPVATEGDPWNLNVPTGVATDAQGNVFISDQTQHTVFKAVLSGTFPEITYQETVVASAGSGGLSFPRDVAVDGAGDVYIADSGEDNQVLKATLVNGNWTVTPIASVNQPNGIAVDGAGNVYVSSYADGAVYKEAGSGSSYTQSTVATGLSSPAKVTVDFNGNVFVADAGNNRVVEETPSGSGYTQSVVGSGLSNPVDVAADPNGNLYVLDLGNNRLLEEFASGSGYTQVELFPAEDIGAVNVDQQGNLYAVTISPPVVFQYNVNFPLGIDFSTPTSVQTQDTADGAQAYTLINNGNTPLTFSVPASGSNPTIASPSFALANTATCPTLRAGGATANLAPFAHCTVAATFSPQTAGQVLGQEVVTDNNLNVTGATQAIPLEGQGIEVLSRFTLTGLPGTATAGVPVSFTLTALTANGLVITGFTDAVNLASSDAQAVFSLTPGGAPISSYIFVNSDAGVKTLYVTFKSAGSQTVTAADGAVSKVSSTVLVSAGAASAISSPGPTVFTSTIGALLGALDVTVTDAYGNPVAGVTVTYGAPSSGPGAVLSATSVQTTSAGTTAVAAYANTIAGGPYSVTATVEGLAGSPVIFTGTNLPDSTSTAIGTSPGSSSIYGTSVTLTATVTPAVPAGPDVVRSQARSGAHPLSGGRVNPAGSSVGPPAVGPPTGTVSFYDTVGGSTRLLGTSAIDGASGSSPDSVHPQTQGTPTVAGSATFTIAAPVGGGHSYTASYGADANFTASASSAAPYAVTLATATVAGPSTQPVLVLVGQAGSIPVTVSGPKKGSSIAPPTGSVSYTIRNASSVVAGSGTVSLAAASSDSSGSIPTSSSLTPGAYTVEVSYLGDGNYAATSVPVTIDFQVGKIATAIAWPPPSAIDYGTSLSAVLDATAKAGSATVAGTFAYTATATGGVPAAVTAATILGAGSYTLAVTFTPADAGTYAASTGSVTLTVEKATASIALVSSANPQYVEDPVRFAATVTSSAGVPAGSVAFYDGSTLLGTVALTSGVAAYTTSSLALGSHAITGVYSGGANFAGATSAAVTETIQDFNLTISTTSGGSTSATASPGGTATYPLVFTPVDGSVFPEPVTLTLSGLPPGATGTLTPDRLPAGSGMTPVTLTVKLPNEASTAGRPGPFGASRLPLALGLLLLPFAGRFRRVLRRLRASRGSSGWIVLVLLAALGLAASAGLDGCGGKPTGYFGQAPETYTLTITGTSGALSHSTTVTLTVE